MTPKNLQDCLRVMNDMAELELALAALYQSCNDAFPDDGDFWLAIKRQEESHAEGIRNIASLVEKNPDAFEVNRGFNAVAIGTIKKMVLEKTAQISHGEIGRDRALIIARDIENSVLEAKYGEFVKTRNIEFMTVIDTLSKQTFGHRELFDRKMRRPAAVIH